MASTPQKRKTLSLDTKYELINQIDKKLKPKAEIAKDFGIKPSTLSMIYKQKDAIILAHESGDYSPKRKRFRSGNYYEIEECLYKWFTNARSSNIAVSDEILMNKANDFAKKLGINDFKSSNGFIYRFKQRRGISLQNVCGESESVDLNIVDDWVSNKLPNLISEYEPKNIFNADETGLFYKCEPSKSLHLKGEKCHGGKRSKERITVLLGANMDGSEKLKPLVIGKFKNPRCFKNVKSLPVDYEANRRAWMNSELFISWVRNLDKKFSREKRHVLLFIDNCPAHPKIDNLRSLKLMFFPPNVTSVLQPMDQGIINSVKVHYRKMLISEKIKCVDKKVDFVVNIKHAIEWINKAWFHITESCIQKCFAKSGFKVNESLDSEISSVDSDNDSDDDIPLAQLRTVFESPVSDMLFDDFVHIDDDLVTREVLTDDMICDQLKTENTSDDEDDDTHTLPDEIVTETEAQQCIDKLKCFVQRQSDSDTKLFNSLNILEEYISKVGRKKQKQSKMTDFFMS